MTTQETPIIGTRRTFDNVIVFLHIDGSLSTRSYHVRGGCLPASKMWRMLDDVCLYSVEELPQFIRDVRAGKLPTKSRPSKERSAEIMASNSAARVAKAWERILNRRAVTYR